MKTPLTLLLMGVVCFYATAQTNRIPGYIVTNQKDTVRGFIVDKNDNWSIKSIEFAKTESGETESYQIKDIDVMFLGTYYSLYLSRELKFDKKPTDVTRLEKDAERHFATEWILLKTMVKGELSLYLSIDENRKNHYFIEKAGKFEELELVRFDKGGRFVQLPFYMGRLQQLANECPRVKTTDVALSDRDLIKFVTQYNSCFGGPDSQVNLSTSESKATVRFGIVAGVQNGNGKFQRGATNSLANVGEGKYSMGAGGFFGLNVEMQPPRASNHSRFGFQVVYQKFASGSLSEKGGNGTRDYKFDISTIRLGPSYKYLFKANARFTPYLKAEVHALIVNSKGTETDVDLFGRVTTSRFTPAGGFGMSSAIGVGVLLSGRLNAEVRYSPNFIPGKEDGLIQVNCVELGLGYLFGK